MPAQGSYPLNARVVAPTDTATGVVQGTTADIPLQAIISLAQILPSGVTSGRPTSPRVGQMWFDLTLHKPIWCSQTMPSVWVDATGTPV